jgi:predicted DNA-binding transcriptional regulator AlpA
MDGFITERELADILGLSMQTVRNMRRQGRGPKPYLLGLRKYGYLRSEVREWTGTRANLVSDRGVAVGIAPAASFNPHKSRTAGTFDQNGPGGSKHLPTTTPTPRATKEQGCPPNRPRRKRKEQFDVC